MNYTVVFKCHCKGQEWTDPGDLEIASKCAEALAKNPQVERIIILHRQEGEPGKILRQWHCGQEVEVDHDLWRCGSTYEVCRALRMVAHTLLKKTRSIALVGPSFEDALKMKDLVVDIVSPEFVRFIASKQALHFANGARAYLYHTKHLSSFFGPRHQFVWVHEVDPACQAVHLARQMLPRQYRSRMAVTRGPICKQ